MWFTIDAPLPFPLYYIVADTITMKVSHKLHIALVVAAHCATTTFATLPAGYTELEYFSIAGNGAANIGGPALLVPQPEQRHTIITVR